MLSRKIAKLLINEKINVDDTVSFLQKHNLLSIYPNILTHLEFKKRKHISFNSLIIESPFKLDESSLEKIKKIADYKQGGIKEMLNEDLLAGFVTRYKGKELDASAIRVIEDFTNTHHI